MNDQPELPKGVETRFIEVRDEGTQMPCMVTAVNANTLILDDRDDDAWLVQRAGWGGEQVGLYFVELLVEPGCDSWAKASPYQYELHTVSKGFDGSRTLRIAWTWVMQHWDEVESGDVIDVQYILGETDAPKAPGRLWKRGAA